MKYSLAVTEYKDGVALKTMTSETVADNVRQAVVNLYADRTLGPDWWNETEKYSLMDRLFWRTSNDGDKMEEGWREEIGALIYFDAFPEDLLGFRMYAYWIQFLRHQQAVRFTSGECWVEFVDQHTYTATLTEYDGDNIVRVYAPAKPDKRYSYLKADKETKHWADEVFSDVGDNVVTPEHIQDLEDRLWFEGEMKEDPFAEEDEQNG